MLNWRQPLVPVPMIGLTTTPFLWLSAGALLALLLQALVLALGFEAPRPAVAAGMAALALVALGVLFKLWGTAVRLEREFTLFRDALEAAPDAFLLMDAQGKIPFAGTAFQRLFRLTPRRLTTGLMAELADGLPEAASQQLARLQACVASGLEGAAEIPLAGAGPTLWRRLSVHPLPNCPGWTLWRAEDTTARHEREEAADEAHARLAALIDVAPVGLYSVDAAGRFLFINGTLAEWLGYAPAELVDDGFRLADLVAGERVLAAPYDPLPGSYSGGGSGGAGEAGRGELILRHRMGHDVPVFLIQTLVRDEEGRVLSTRSAITRSPMPGRELEQALQKSEKRFQWLFSEAPVAIALLDLSGTVTGCNRAFCTMVGAEPDAVEGSPFTAWVAKEDGPDVAAQLSKLVMGTSRAAHIDVRLAGERELMASLYVSRSEDENGDVSGLVLHFIDTTEQKNLEVQFAQSQKMQAMGQLAGGVAHDFNNLLTAMIGFCDLLLLRHRADDASHSDLTQIKQNANRAANLVRQLLAFSRRQTLQPRILNPTDSLDDLSTLLRRLIGENIELEMIHGTDIGLVRADPGQFDQVIINLAVNARDAMPGGGTLTLRTGNITLAAPIQRGHEVMPPGKYVLIEVIDTGVGIPKENLGRIFEPFFSTKQVGEGTGLGLSTVYGILRQTDGFVFVDSAPGEGTTFSIYLPRFEADEFTVPVRPAAERDGGDATGAGTGTILLVEDEDAVRLFGARALRNKGYDVLEASSGEAALEAIVNATRPIDVLITDVIMPGMNGPTLVRLVREEIPDIRVILISGYAEDAFRNEIGEDLDIHFLPKPFSLKQLAGKVREVMNEGRGEGE